MNSVKVVDGYTKVVLTVIAVALCILVGQNMVPTASALGQSNCGRLGVPCYVEIDVNLSGRVD
ncbi:hypothetical protein [Candidatus Rariloculus sp.]|uniref:hypothetical protein n=1 Tax=Candidatus Rariloculus sp. TaxID=3101265 RepID=UPI003D14AAFD